MIPMLACSQCLVCWNWGKVSEREEAALQMFHQPDQKSRKRSEALAGQQRELVLRRAKTHFGDKAFAPAFEAGIDLLRLNLSRHDAKEQGVMHIAHAYVTNDFTPFPLKQLCKRLLQSWVAAWIEEGKSVLQDIDLESSVKCPSTRLCHVTSLSHLPEQPILLSFRKVQLQRAGACGSYGLGGGSGCSWIGAPVQRKNKHANSCGFIRDYRFHRTRSIWLPTETCHSADNMVTE